jgi:adenylylsulfate kinase-like enzyme
MIPVLWLCGPPGVGKSTVAWQLYALLSQAGVPSGYVDIDQLGMCFPERPSDPGRYRLQAANLDAVVAAYQDAGARCVVVSGVIDPAGGVIAGRMPRAAVTVCRLRADDTELARRLVARQGNDQMVAAALAEAEALDVAGFGDLCIDTSGLGVAEVVGLLRERLPGWPAVADPVDTGTSWEPCTEDGAVLWVTGATGVGKSTVGFGIFAETTFHRQIPGAYVDLDQVGFVSPALPDDPMHHRMRARILAALWRTFRAAGAQNLTIVGPVPDEATIKVYAEALPAATITVCRLHASRSELTRRILQRGRGDGWAQPGDPLKGQPEAHLLTLAEQATAVAEALERSTMGDFRFDTDGLTPSEITEAVMTRTAWPPTTARRCRIGIDARACVDSGGPSL